jgi:hypothetical protein
MTHRLALLALLLAMALACRASHPATSAQCAALLDRLVELELQERGFHDPLLVDRWRNDARAKFAEELEACRGRPLPAKALDCAAHAKSAEEVAHRCLK